MPFDGIPQIHSRMADIKRTAQELSINDTWRAQFLATHAGPRATKRQMIDAHAVIDPNISDAEYRLLSFRSYFLNDSCDNYFVATDREAAMLGKSIATIERASTGLEGKYQTSKRRRNDSSIRKFAVPQKQLEAAEELVHLFELQEAETANLRVVNPETANLQFRTRKSEGLTLVLNSTDERIGARNSYLSSRGAKRKLPRKIDAILHGEVAL